MLSQGTVVMLNQNSVRKKKTYMNNNKNKGIMVHSGNLRLAVRIVFVGKTFTFALPLINLVVLTSEVAVF